jgi:hypothetical protein
MPNKKHFYLLQGLVYLKLENRHFKLTCGKPNANRPRGGVVYYCVPSSSTNFLRHQVDAQIPAHFASLQVSEELLPRLRDLYRSDISRYTKNIGRERYTLEIRRRKLEEKELNLWRAFTDHGMRPEIYEKLTREIRDKRDKVEVRLDRLGHEPSNRPIKDIVTLYVDAGIVSMPRLLDGYRRAEQLGHGTLFLDTLKNRTSKAFCALEAMCKGISKQGCVAIDHLVAPSSI